MTCMLAFRLSINEESYSSLNRLVEMFQVELDEEYEREFRTLSLQEDDERQEYLKAHNRLEMSIEDLYRQKQELE